MPDNLPANVEAIVQLFCLTLISSRVKVNIQKTNNNLLIRFCQLPPSLMKLFLDPNNGSLPPAYQRLLLLLSAATLAFLAKIYQITDLNILLETLRDFGVSTP